MKRAVLTFAVLLAGLSLLAGAQPSRAADGAARKRVAVINFEFGTVSRWWSGDWNVGKGISDLVVTNLVKDGTYSVIERKAIDEVLKEQDLGEGGRVDPKTAAKIGKILGVNAIITGSVTQFGFEDKSFKLGGIGGNIGGIGLGGFGTKKQKAIVVVDARMIDTTTGEILAVATGKGESRRDNFSGFAGGGGRGGFGAAGIDMGSSNFQQTIIGEATRKCVDALSVELIRGSGKVEGTKFELAGKVADVDEDTLVINIGKDHGVKVGDTLDVHHIVREVKDPDTGKTLREVTEVIGTLRITEVDDKSATGRYSGATKPMVGDRVKNR